VIIEYDMFTPADPSDVIATVYVNYKNFNGLAPYAKTLAVSGGNGVGPIGNCDLLPLSAGDRIWMEVDVADGDLEYTYATLALWSIGE